MVTESDTSEAYITNVWVCVFTSSTKDIDEDIFVVSAIPCAEVWEKEGQEAGCVLDWPVDTVKEVDEEDLSWIISLSLCGSLKQLLLQTIASFM